ncbi:MAG: NUDIX domain-containing protein [Planctomycetales bacterium]|nr:NUDIX domain-containing protein [Planctomycetales bacterium]
MNTTPRNPPPSAPRRRGVVGVLIHESRWLVIRRSRHVAAPRKLCFPGGGIEHGESEAEALVRELQEELGVRAEAQRQLWRSQTARGVDLAWWHARLLDPISAMAPNPAEVEEAFWMPPTEIRHLPELLDSNIEFLDAWTAGEFQLPDL